MSLSIIVWAHTHTRLTALCPGLPGWASTRKVKTNLNFAEARDGEWQWYQLAHMQVCTSLQTDNHAITPPLSLPFLPPNQQRQSTERNCMSIWTKIFYMLHLLSPYLFAAVLSPLVCIYPQLLAKLLLYCHFCYFYSIPELPKIIAISWFL